jgi:hypothetical protein
MNPQELFNESLNELENRLRSGKTYDVLMAAGLLRKLLIDADPLINQIVKRERILFLVNVREPLHIRLPQLYLPQDLRTSSWLAKDGLNPDDANKQDRFYNPQTLSLEEFLTCKVIYTRGKTVTVKELIRILSNKEGAVHYQRTLDINNEEDMKALLTRQLSASLWFGNQEIPAAISTFTAICKIVLRDLIKFKK